MFCLWGRDWGAEEGREQWILIVWCFVPFTVQWMEEWIKLSFSNQPWPLLDPSQWNQTPAAGNEEWFCVSSFFQLFLWTKTQWNFNVKSYLWNIYFGVYRLKTSHFAPHKTFTGIIPESVTLHPVAWLSRFHQRAITMNKKCKYNVYLWAAGLRHSILNCTSASVFFRIGNIDWRLARC